MAAHNGSILVLGADGMLARAFRERLQSGASFLGRAGCDITDANSVKDAVTPVVRTVINCAAYTNVDGAETDEAAATRLNGEAVSILAARCVEVGATLVHFSTDYVFDGRATSPYATDHPRDPLGAYGRSKAAGETALEASRCAWLCLRTSWLYAPWGKNFVRTIATLSRERDSLRVVADQRGRPTSCRTLADITMRMLDAGARGMHHGCDGGECTWHEFAQAIAARVNPGCAVDPCTTAEFPRPAPRPAYSVLDLSKTEALIGPIPHWSAALSDTLDLLEREEPAA
ncbi:MAG: dTDP-4-dehydrorhamnose reductase [Phycisphaerales bacterium]